MKNKCRGGPCVRPKKIICLLIFLFQCILYYTLIAKYSSQNREIMLNYIALSRALDNNIRYLVIGDPVSHSRSPGLQNAAFEALVEGL